MTSSMSLSNDNLTSILHHHHHTTFAGSPTLVMLNAVINDTIIEGIQVVVSLATDSPPSMVINHQTQTFLGSSTLIESKNLHPQRYVGAFLLHAVDDDAFDRLEALIPPHILKLYFCCELNIVPSHDRILRYLQVQWFDIQGEICND